MKQRESAFGSPGAIIAAAFIGPGTVTVCTLAGVQHGLVLLWAVLLSAFITIIFQNMAVRISIVKQQDITTVLSHSIKSPVLRNSILGGVVAAIVIGSCAYEAGNITGGSLGIDTFYELKFGNNNISPLVVGLLAFLALWFGNSKIIMNILTVMVIIMSASFFISATLVFPDLFSFLSGLFIPKIPENSLMLVLGVIGTTVVPYNLFLHAAIAKKQWKNKDGIAAARKDTIIAVLVGAFASMAIIVSASALKGVEIKSALDMAEGLSPIYGSISKYLVSTGLFAAGITSAITAPLAAAFVMTSVFGWNTDVKSKPFRIIWIMILLSGVLFSSFGYNPIELIQFAQIANGLLLPIIAILIIWINHQKSIMGIYQSTLFQTTLSSLLIFIIIILGLKGIVSVF